MHYLKHEQESHSILHTLYGPLIRINTYIESTKVRQKCSHYYGLNLDNPNAVWNFAKCLHDQLEAICQGFTFSQEEVGAIAL
jgi:hypothetical protein